LGKRIPRAAAAQGIGAVGAEMVLIGGGALDARANLPHVHPWHLSHGGDVVAILWPTPRVPEVSSRAKGPISPGGAFEAGARAPARLSVCASTTPAIPSHVHARGV
jgi:hypothetical protein